MSQNPTSLKGLIFDIQRYSLHDGPGIRTTVFFKGCPLRCQWCANPESFNKKPEVAYHQKDCIACHACVFACTKNAITPRERGIYIDREKCTQNFSCVNTCPTGALTIFGKWYTTDEIMDEVVKDKAFYKNSGGGMTLSGGEVLLQSDFASKLLKQAQQAGIHTAIETSGFAPWADCEKVIQHTDLVLLDIKLVNSEKHRAFTGVDNRIILNNLEHIIASGKKFIARIPLIPTVNMDNESVDDFISLIKTKGIKETNLLPFHQLGEGKYDMMGLTYPFKSVKVSDDDQVQKIANRMADAGIDIKIGG